MCGRTRPDKSGLVSMHQRYEFAGKIFVNNGYGRDGGQRFSERIE